MQKLYYEDSHLFEFTATVTDIRLHKAGNVIVLDKTAFFPMGGGQPGDEGIVGNAFVYDVQEENGEVLHFTKDTPAFKIGETVECKLDGELRFSRMQAHSGEHIFSGVAHNLFGVENVGFHLIDLVMTVDFDKPLTKEQIEVIEKEANKWVYRNVPITTEILSGDKLVALQYRSKLDISEDVRIVTIEGCDKCACCAPHVSHTGEIGLIKVISSISHRGGVRITLICGVKALEDYSIKHKDIMKISDMLKVPGIEAFEAVEGLCEKITEEKKNIQAQRQKLYDYIYDGLNTTEHHISLFVDGLSSEEVRELADLCKEKTASFAAVLSGTECEGYSYAISSESISLKQYFNEINTALSGRGGGRNEMLQGRFNAQKIRIIDFFNEFEVKLHENA